MKHWRILALGLVCATLCGGCHTGGTGSATRALGSEPAARITWARAKGGLVSSAESARLERLGDRFAGVVEGRQLRLQLLGADAPAAYCWPDGRIYVTRGLMAWATDEEVMAAIAHELGHLLDEGHLGPQMGLRGGSGPGAADRESRADLMAVRILRAAGVPPAALVDLLRRLHDEPTLPTGSRRRLGARVTRLAAELASLEARP